MVQTLISAIAAVTGQPAAAISDAFDTEMARTATPPAVSRHAELPTLVDLLSTRVGLSAALAVDEVAAQRDAMVALRDDDTGRPTPQVVQVLLTVLRRTPEVIPTLDRGPVVFPAVPPHQVEMWHTLLDLELAGLPRLLVGGQMTVVHRLEHGVMPPRTTDDGDIVLNVWTRRDSLRAASGFLRDRGFTEDRTSDGYSTGSGATPGP